MFDWRTIGGYRAMGELEDMVLVRSVGAENRDLREA